MDWNHLLLYFYFCFIFYFIFIFILSFKSLFGTFSMKMIIAKLSKSNMDIQSNTLFRQFEPNYLFKPFFPEPFRLSIRNMSLNHIHEWIRSISVHMFENNNHHFIQFIAIFYPLKPLLQNLNKIMQKYHLDRS